MSQTNTKIQTQIHEPVLLREVLDTLTPKRGDKYLDLTAGYGGHASEVLRLTKSSAVLVDRDDNAISVLSQKFAGQFGGHGGVTLLHLDFLQAAKKLVEEQKQFDCILVDLGVSSPHLDKADRGFSLKSEGPLDMRMDSNQILTANEVVNTYSVEDLSRILREYGEEPKARQMARTIVAERPLQTTTELANIAKKVWPGYSKVHPATRLFQAVRIEVNDELGQLSEVLPYIEALLAPGGRVGIISFHSLEDRLVKRFFKDRAGDTYDAELELITKKPVTASENELAINPRARSAKLRVAKRKIKTKEGMG
jgi:16S rRNA (cytosine1402-N4)-methyltransferase